MPDLPVRIQTMSLPETKNKLIPVLMLEDQPIIQNRMRLAFASSERYELLAVCGTVDEALNLLPRIHPAIFLVDLELPGKSGEELIPVVRSKYPAIKIVVFTVFEDQERIVRLMRLGIRGYLLKDISDELFLPSWVSSKPGGQLSPNALRKSYWRRFRETLSRFQIR